MRRSRGTLLLIVIAILSVSTNLLLLGAVVGERSHPRSQHGELDTRLERLWRRMPEDDRPVVRAIIERHRDELEMRWGALRDGVEGARATLRATPFRADLAVAAFADENRRYESYRVAMQELLGEIAGRISQSGRDQLFPAYRGGRD